MLQPRIAPRRRPSCSLPPPPAPTSLHLYTPSHPHLLNTQDSQGNFDDCCLTLQPAVNPVVTPDGFLFSREAILENLLQQKKTIKRKLAEWEADNKAEADKVRGGRKGGLHARGVWLGSRLDCCHASSVGGEHPPHHLSHTCYPPPLNAHPPGRPEGRHRGRGRPHRL
jgi:hypothetical protein